MSEGEELKPREVFVVGWTGMRGVLALAGHRAAARLLLWQVELLWRRLISLVENSVECSLGFLRALRQHILCRLKMEKKSLEALQ